MLQKDREFVITDLTYVKPAPANTHWVQYGYRLAGPETRSLKGYQTRALDALVDLGLVHKVVTQVGTMKNSVPLKKQVGAYRKTITTYSAEIFSY